MERRMTGNCHVRCGAGENSEIISKNYLSLFGEIPQFDKLIATIRSREISASIILQTKSQLKAIYKDNADTIEGNCDTMLFLGGKEKTTLKEISESLGKETIDSYNTSTNRGQSESYADMEITGIRKSEGGIRSANYKTCFSDSKSKGCATYRPIFWYSDGDKRDYEDFYGVTHSRCYSEYGMRRTGCVGCPFNQHMLTISLTVLSTTAQKRIC